MRLIQEQKERVLLKTNKPKQVNGPIVYKDIETKTFYTGRVLQEFNKSIYLQDNLLMKDILMGIMMIYAKIVVKFFTRTK